MPKSILTIEKIYLDLKLISWKFIVPILIAIVLAAIGFSVSVAGSNIIPSVISGITLMAFIGLFLSLFLIYWYKYFKNIKYKMCEMFIVPNSRFEKTIKENTSKLNIVYIHLIDYVYSLANIYDIYITKKDIENYLRDTIVFFTDDISEKSYNTRWSTKYKHIAGLCGGNSILVEFNDNYKTILDTALEHELAHIIMQSIQSKMNANIYKEICSKLGLER